MGHIVNAEGVATDPEKVKAIENFPIPKNITDVRSFVGLSGFFRSYVKDFAQIAEPLTRLNRKNVGFIWTEEQQNAFDTIKSHMCKAPILIHFDNTLPIEVRCDGCTKGLGSILLYKIDNKYRVIRYDSRLLNDAEKN